MFIKYFNGDNIILQVYRLNLKYTEKTKCGSFDFTTCFCNDFITLHRYYHFIS